MELRIANPRATKDIDLAVRDIKLMSRDPKEQSAAILSELRSQASLDLEDFFLFQIEDPVMDLEAAPYGGARFPVTVMVDGRLFVRFSLDVAVGDPLIEPLDILNGENWLEFAGLPSKGIPALSKEQQFAERLHAYTLPRDGRTNSRVKDLIDMILLIQTNSMDTIKIHEATKATWLRRRTHELPEKLAVPPEEWAGRFQQLAEECHLSMTLEGAYAVVCDFYIQFRDASETKVP